MSSSITGARRGVRSPIAKPAVFEMRTNLQGSKIFSQATHRTLIIRDGARGGWGQAVEAVAPSSGNVSPPPPPSGRKISVCRGIFDENCVQMHRKVPFILIFSPPVGQILAPPLLIIFLLCLHSSPSPSVPRCDSEYNSSKLWVSNSSNLTSETAFVQCHLLFQNT